MVLQDVYRIGTLMELVRVLSLSFADDGKRIKVYVYPFWVTQFNMAFVKLNRVLFIIGLCSRVYGGRCTCRNAIAACGNKKDLGVHGLG